MLQLLHLLLFIKLFQWSRQLLRLSLQTPGAFGAFVGAASERQWSSSTEADFTSKSKSFWALLAPQALQRKFQNIYISRVYQMKRKHQKNYNHIIRIHSGSCTCDYCKNWLLPFDREKSIELQEALPPGFTFSKSFWKLPFRLQGWKTKVTSAQASNLWNRLKKSSTGDPFLSIGV